MNKLKSKLSAKIVVPTIMAMALSGTYVMLNPMFSNADEYKSVAIESTVESTVESMSESITENTTKAKKYAKKIAIPLSAKSTAFNIIDSSFDSVKENSKELCNTLLDKVMPKPVSVSNAKAELSAVTEITITWDPEEGREYTVGWDACAAYVENVTIVYPKAGLCYLTGLRTDTDYNITITPIVKDDENLYPVEYKTTVHTSNPEVIQEFDYIDGWTNCFAGERASGLTAMPSSGAIYGSTCDKVTGTGIRRHANGDYACAMGTHFGYCNDRFLIELDNGIQFTTRICDSKGCGDVQDEWGYGLWHNFGGSGKCIIEFIWDDGNIPGCVSFSGSWGGYNWNGLNLGANIKSIKKLANYDV